MRARLLVASIVLSIFCVPGCRDEFVSNIYDPCSDLGECVPSADLCEDLSIDLAGQPYTESICTVYCSDEGPGSPDCPLAAVGRNGSCYPADLVGGANADPVCFEPCDSNGDCLSGFRCFGADELCPNDPNCPVVDGDRICVPGPR
ncbi:MAG: hypothetical protein WBG86_04590 [Polyangiales bacterium]